MGVKKADRDPEKLCRYIRADGTQCGRYRAKGSDICEPHDSLRKKRVIERLQKGRKAKMRNKKTQPAVPAGIEEIPSQFMQVKADPRILECVPQINNPKELRQWLSAIVGLANSERTDPKRLVMYFTYADKVMKTFEAEEDKLIIPGSVLKKDTGLQSVGDQEEVPPIETGEEEDFGKSPRNEDEGQSAGSPEA